MGFIPKEDIYATVGNNFDDMNEFLQTLSALKENGLNGIVLPSTSLKHALLESKVDAAPLFGSLSKIMQRDFEASHTLLMLVREEKIDEIKEQDD